MSLDYEMNGIFPVPIYFTKLKKFTDMELKVIRLMENQSAKNMGNSRSDDTFVLKSKHFENIRKQLMSLDHRLINTLLNKQSLMVQLYKYFMKAEKQLQKSQEIL